MSEQKQQVGIPYPPEQMMKHKRPPADVLDTLKAQGTDGALNVIEKIDAPAEGGIYVYYKGLPYPRKGWPTPHSVQATQLPKRALINAIHSFASKDLILPYLGFVLLPKRVKIRIIKRFLDRYVDFADMSMGPYYFEERFYSKAAKGIRKFIETFLDTIGVPHETSARFAEVIATFFELDTAYMWRFQDIASSTSHVDVLANPAKEIQRLLEMLNKRDHSQHVKDSYSSIGLILKVVLFIPSIKKAFVKAVKSIQFSDLQFDEADRFHVCRLGGYDFFGETIEERLVKYPEVEAEKYVIS